MLKYLFVAQYNDDSLFYQTPEDISITRPGTGSAFSDIEHDKLTGFALQGEGHTYAVDLLDGHFEIDGIPFKVYDENINNRRLIYFRRNFYHTGAETGHEVEYHLGWQGNDSTGKNIQRVIIIS